ncbi:MAG: hypothetical protein ABS56_05025 [Lautropia sp. SCN 69-89]|nr:MAG: hypothetical protein ABS56_05025 [Lautropia sp. SCN 69-89]
MPRSDRPAAAHPKRPHLSTTFDSFGFAEPILRAVTELGYREPTPIQAQAIPVVMQGRDVMGAAQTGTGKTAGFALPILQRLMPLANTSASPARHPVRALILAPTRELADQIYENVREYAKYTGLKSAVVFGGVDIKPQIAALRQGCEVLIATPGRLLDHMGQKTVSLAQAELLVLDEADRMLDMGFLPDIQRIIHALPARRQNLMFSATFSTEIRKLAETFLNDPVLIEVARRNATAENVEQLVFRVADIDAKRAAVAKLVRERQLQQVIVFTNTKIGAGRLARLLERDGLNAAAIHGDKSQQERLATLEAFKKGEIVVLVATDVAARGLDIVELPAVINYDLPYSAEDYVHRIGRTGRAGASGVALSLMTGNDERLLVEIEKLIKRKLPVESLDLGPAEARPRRERREAPDARRERAAGAPKRRRPEGESRMPRASGYSTDPFFSQPYEPSQAEPAEAAAQAGAAPEVPARGSVTGPRKSARPLAALLGGGRKG